MSANNYDTLTDAELHTKLKSVGLDLPVSINRDFLIRKLQQVESNRRQTIGGNNNVAIGTNARQQKRLSLNVPVQTVPAPNSRPARNSISTNHQIQPAQLPPAPPTPPRNHKQLTPPRQAAKTATPPPPPLTPPPSVRKQKPKPATPPRTQKIPFTNKYVPVVELDESEEEEPVEPLPKQFGGLTRRSTSILQSCEPITPPAPELTIERVESYMKLFNKPVSVSTPTFQGPKRTRSGNYSSDDEEDSGDEITLRRKTIVSRGIDWSKYKNISSQHMPSTSNALIYLIVAFFLITFGVYFANKFQNNNNLEDPPIVAIDNRGQHKTSFVPLCGLKGVDSRACIPEGFIKDAKLLFAELRDELNERRHMVDCRNSDDELAVDNLSIAKTKSLLYRLSSLNKPRIDATFKYLLYLIIENPKWGLIVETEISNGTREQLHKINQLVDDIRSDQLVDDINLFVTTTHVDRAWYCTMYKGAYHIISYVAMAAVIGFFIFGFYLALSLYQKQKKESEQKLYTMIEDILNLLQEHHENSQVTNDDPLAIQHIRDNLIQPSERTPDKMKLWNNAIQYILNNESRVREEIHHIRGEEYRVLKWLPTISPKRGNSIGGGWQGPAFEIIDGSPNSVPLDIPTNCLKIRHMYDTAKSSLTEEIKTKIEASLHTKAEIELKHIGYDSHNDCCVYIKCFTKDDAKKAYINLHGWWYNGKLLSVKFLREERYNTRFPEAAK